jgi:transposase
MDWRRLLAYITGSVDEHLLLRNEYLTTENRVLRAQIKGRLRLSDPERKSLAEIGKRLGRKLLQQVATIVSPDTILRWHRELVARKFDGSRFKKGPGRPRIRKETEALVVKFAQENRRWGYDRIVGEMRKLGTPINKETVQNVLKRHGIPPAPERRKGTPWNEFISTHKAVLAAADFFTVEAWSAFGLVTYYVLFFIHVGSRRVHIAGVTEHPHDEWIKQIARNLTMTGWGFLEGMKYLIHDRDAKFTDAFRSIVRSAGVKPVALPPRSPNLNAYCE